MIDDPGGLGFRIERIWAFVAVHGDGDEGVCAVKVGDMLMPLIAADEERLKLLRPTARRLAREGNKRIKLIRFEQRVEVEELA